MRFLSEKRDEELKLFLHASDRPTTSRNGRVWGRNILMIEFDVCKAKTSQNARRRSSPGDLPQLFLSTCQLLPLSPTSVYMYPRKFEAPISLIEGRAKRKSG
jgi:hypothetical protein